MLTNVQRYNVMALTICKVGRWKCSAVQCHGPDYLKGGTMLTNVQRYNVMVLTISKVERC